MIEGWNSKHPWKHVCMQAAREVVHWACGRLKKSWAWRTEQNANAVPCKVCARSCCRLRWGVHTQQHQCTNPEQSCGSDAGFENITGNVFESDQGKSPGHGRHALEWCCEGGCFHSNLHRRRQSGIKNYASIGQGVCVPYFVLYVHNQTIVLLCVIVCWSRVHVCVCVCAWVYACMRACVHACMRACVCTCVCASEENNFSECLAPN